MKNFGNANRHITDFQPVMPPQTETTKKARLQPNETKSSENGKNGKQMHPNTSQCTYLGNTPFQRSFIFKFLFTRNVIL